MLRAHFVIENRYFDSIVLMEISGRLAKVPGVIDASVMTGAAGNLELLADTGFLETPEGARPSDLICCLKMERDVAREARAALELALEDTSVDAGDDEERPAPRSLESSMAHLPGANLLFLSIPGPQVRFEAKKALRAGLNVMIFSDNVPIEAEIELKRYARERGLLVMGPDCGTAILGGAALGFANVVRPGPIGIVGASGTGIQEVTCVIDALGSGITHAIGTGGRDLKAAVGGLSMLTGIDLLDADPATRVILLISKPPDRPVTDAILARVKRSLKPFVIVFLGETFASDGNIHGAGTLEGAARAAVALANGKPPAPDSAAFADPAAPARAKTLLASLNGKPPGAIRALYSGGTLWSEAKMVLKAAGLPITVEAGPSADLRHGTGLPDGHVLLDLGDDEFTVGRPHPMIDSTLRADYIRAAGADPRVGILLFDIVAGHGSHADPAGSLADALREAKAAAAKRGAPLLMVAACTGTEADPQPRALQERTLRDLGVEVLPTAVQAARFAAALATGGAKFLD